MTKEAGVAASASVVSASACIKSIGRGVCATADLGSTVSVNLNTCSNDRVRVDAPWSRRAHQGGHRGSRSADRPSTEKLKSCVGRHKARVFELCRCRHGSGWVESIGAAQDKSAASLPRAGQGDALCAVQKRGRFCVVAERAELLERAPAERVQSQRFAEVRHRGLDAVRLPAYDAQQELASGAAGNLPVAASETWRRQPSLRLRRTSSPAPLVSACSASESNPISTQATASR